MYDIYRMFRLTYRPLAKYPWRPIRHRGWGLFCMQNSRWHSADNHTSSTCSSKWPSVFGWPPGHHNDWGKCSPETQILIRFCSTNRQFSKKTFFSFIYFFWGWGWGGDGFPVDHLLLAAALNRTLIRTWCRLLKHNRSKHAKGSEIYSKFRLMLCIWLFSPRFRE